MNKRWIMAFAAAGAVALLSVPLLLDGTGTSAGGLLPPPSNGACKAESAANLDFTVKDMNGASVKLADYKGKVVLLNFWATWCGPCKMEIPEFIELQKAYGDKGFAIIGVAVEDTPEAVRKYAGEMKINYPLVMNQEDIESVYGPVYGLPMSFFIARDGSICKKHLGPISKEAAEKEIKGLL